MKETVTGILTKVDEEHLIIEWDIDTEPVAYPHKGLDIKAGWVNRFLGTKVRCQLIDGVIRSISQAW